MERAGFIWISELKQADVMEAHLKKDMTFSSMPNYTQIFVSKGKLITLLCTVTSPID